MRICRWPDCLRRRSSSNCISWRRCKFRILPFFLLECFVALPERSEFGGRSIRFHVADGRVEIRSVGADAVVI